MKMIKLIQNETIKTFKKTSTKILILLAFLSLLAAIGLAHLVMVLNDMPMNFAQNEEDWKAGMKEEVSSMKKSIELNTGIYDKTTIAGLKAKIDTYELALENNVNYNGYYYNRSWKIELLSEIEEQKQDLYINEELMDVESKNEKEKHINEKISVLKKDNFVEYIDLLKKNKKEMLDTEEISKKEYEDEIYLLDLRKKYEISKEQEGLFDWKSSLYEDISSMKNNLRTGINQNTGKLLKIEEIEELENNLKIAEYRLENNIPVLSSGSSARSMYDMFAPAFSLGLISILMIIIAGSGISTEISKGTIKFLLFTPNKRWKVLLSKILSALIILICVTLILSLVSVVFGNLFFKEDGTIYVYVSNGVAKSIPNTLYTILYFFASCIDILVYMLFAFMLSVITRNTALSVGLSIACYIGSGIVMQLINAFITADWLKFIPFNNLGLADRIFANNISYVAMQNASGFMANVSVGFSLSLLGVCAILMIITMFDSFNKRDIV